jgi:hypothetical protein
VGGASRASKQVQARSTSVRPIRNRRVAPRSGIVVFSLNLRSASEVVCCITPSITNLTGFPMAYATDNDRISTTDADGREIPIPQPAD